MAKFSLLTSSNFAHLVRHGRWLNLENSVFIRTDIPILACARVAVVVGGVLPMWKVVSSIPSALYIKNVVFK